MTIKNILTGAAIMLLVSVVAYGQHISVTSLPVTGAISTGRAELVGSITVTAGPAGTVADTIVVKYGGLPITNKATGPTGISLTGTGGWDGATLPTFVPDRKKGTVTITSPAVSSGTAATFTLAGVRVSVDGSGLSSVKATVTPTNNPIFVGGVAGNEVTGASTVTDGIKSFTTKTGVIFLATTGNNIASETPSASASGELRIAEPFKNAYQSAGQFGFASTQGTQFRLTVTGLASKVTFTTSTITAIDADGDATVLAATPASATLKAPTADEADLNKTTIEITNSSLAKTETIKIPFTVSTTGATKPLSAVDIVATVTLLPKEDALLADDAGGTLQPKYATSEVSTTAGSIIPGTSNLYLPLVVWASGFDTGIQISNTTKDPFGSKGAVPQEGTITFHFWANDGTAGFSYPTTSGSPGSGLTAGVLKAGSTYTVLASELLKAAGRTTSFTGYAIAVVGTTHGHGNVFVSDFKGFTQGVPMLVIPPTAIKNRATQAFETLTP